MQSINVNEASEADNFVVDVVVVVNVVLVNVVVVVLLVVNGHIILRCDQLMLFCGS